MRKLTRTTRLETLEARLAPAELLHSLFPDPTGPQDYSGFGTAVAVSATHVVAGAPGMDLSGNANVGQVSVFDLDGNLQRTLNHPAPAAYDGFGTSLAVSGHVVVVGSPLDDAGAIDSGSVYVYDLSSATPDVPAFTLTNPTPTIDDRFGTSVALSGHHVVIGAPFDDAGGANAGAAYVYDLSSATPQVPTYVLSNPAPAAGDNFGASVAIAGDVAVVGVPGDDGGTVYVFDLSSPTPAVPTLTLSNPSPTAWDDFGASVSASGRLVVVGAPNMGSVYVYDMTSTTPAVPTHSLVNPNTNYSHFGLATAVSTVSGDLVVAGAYVDYLGYPGRGIAYVFDLSSTTPAQTLTNPTDPGWYDQFGFSVAVRGDSVVVGAPYGSAGAAYSGATYVFDLKSAAPALQLGNVGPASYDSFASSSAMDGTILVVGAQNDDAGAADAGAAYVFDLGSAAPAVPVLTLYNPSPAIGDGFGTAVAVSDNLVVVGATYAQDWVGSAFVYDLTSATPTLPTITLENPTPTIGERFGSSVAVSGHFVIIGAYRDSALVPIAGAVYVYDLNSATPAVPVLTLNNPLPTTSSHFGHSVALSGDTVVVGAPGGNVRRSFVYDLSSATPAVPVLTLNDPIPTVGREFGHSVAVSGQYVSIGAPAWTNASNAGRTYVYDRISATPTVPILTLKHPNPSEGNQFGYSVAMSGTRVIVGSLVDVFVFDLASATPAVATHTILQPGAVYYWEFGTSVAVSGELVAVGSPYDGTQNPAQGAAYIYTLAPPRIADVQINDGFAQRSRVTSLGVTFDQPVTFAANPAAAFQLTRQSDGASVGLNSFVNDNTVTLTFTGGPLDFGSLADGRYTLSVDAAKVSNSNGLLDGDADGTAGGDYVLVGTPANGLFRLFGDADGDGDVDAQDFGAFRLALGTFSNVFSFDGGGAVDALDFGQFRRRFGAAV